MSPPRNQPVDRAVPVHRTLPYSPFKLRTVPDCTRPDIQTQNSLVLPRPQAASRILRTSGPPPSSAASSPTQPVAFSPNVKRRVTLSPGRTRGIVRRPVPSWRGFSRARLTMEDRVSERVYERGWEIEEAIRFEGSDNRQATHTQIPTCCVARRDGCMHASDKKGIFGGGRDDR